MINIIYICVFYINIKIHIYYIVLKKFYKYIYIIWIYIYFGLDSNTFRVAMIIFIYYLLSIK